MDGSDLLEGNHVSDSWDQNQVAGNIGMAETIALQQLLNSDVIPNGLGPGEMMYVMVGDITYQLVGPSKAGGEITITPLNSNMSLEDLAAISAEQESIKPDYSYQVPMVQSTSADNSASQSDIAQQLIQASGNVFTSNDGMQVIMMPGDESSKTTPGGTIKLDGQNIFLQHNHQIPTEIQEMIAKGLPGDMSNYELVIEGEQGIQQNFVLQQSTDEVNILNNIKSQIIGRNTIVTEPQPKNSVYVQVITACPGEFDDGEFAYLAPDNTEISIQSNQPRVLPTSPYINAYLEFVKNGAKVELADGKQSDDKMMSASKNPFLANQQGRSIKRKKMLESDGEVDEKSLKNADFDDPLWKIGAYRSEDQRSSGRGRGKGRGRTPSFASPQRLSSLMAQHDLSKLHGFSNELQFEFPVSYIMQNEPHNCTKGDFVVDKKDAYKSEFPIWRIENGKLLQKFESFMDGGILFHKSASIYSSWSGDIKVNFKAILVDIISAGSAPSSRKHDVIVKVHDKYIPKPSDESLEQNALMQLFNIYAHALLNQAFSPTYLSSIQQQDVAYLLEPISQIDQLIMEAKQAVCSDFNWNPDFQLALETWSCYTFTTLKAGEPIQACQAISDGSEASHIVKFYGQSYDRDSLVVNEDCIISNSQEFNVGKIAFANLGIYHALHHFKYLLFKKCYEEAVYIQSNVKDKLADDIPNICAQNRIWVQQMFRDLKGLLDRYIIIKTEEDNSEALEMNGVHMTV